MAVTTSESVTPKTVNGTPVEAPTSATVAEPKAVSHDDVEIELFHEFTNNATEAEGGVRKFGPGKVRVDRATADDLLRRQQAVLKSERDLIQGTDLSSGQIANLG